MQVLSSAVVIHVSDLGMATNFYTQVLGFDPDFTFGDYAGLTHNHICIHLNGPKNTGGIKKEPGNAHVCFECDEVDDFYSSVIKNKVLIVAPIADRVYGMRDFAINDPDGNTLVFGSVISEQ